MIVLLLNGYIAILVSLIWLRVVPANLFWKISPVLVLFPPLVGLFMTAAIYADHVTAGRVVRQAAPRQQAILNDIAPF